MTKTQLNIRAGESTIEKVKTLAARYNDSQAQVVAIAIDRMYQEEMMSKYEDDVMDLYLGPGITPADLRSLTLAQIEDQIADMVREHALDSEPESTEAEINSAIEDAAALIYQAARTYTAAEVRQAAQDALDNWDWSAEPDLAAGMQYGLEAIRDYRDEPLELDRAYSDIWHWLDEIARGYAAEIAR